MKSNRIQHIPEQMRGVFAAALLFFLLAAGPVSAQGFFKQYFDGFSLSAAWVDTLPDGYRMLAYGSSPGGLNTYILTTDLNGNPVDTISISGSTDFWTYFYDGSRIRLVGDTAIQRVDLAGTVLWTSLLTESSENSALVTEQSTVLVLGTSLDSANNTVHVVQKFDPETGDLVWTYTDAQGPWSYAAYGLPTPNGGYFLVMQDNQFSKANRMLQLDGNGNTAFDVARPSNLPMNQIIWIRQWANGITGIYGYSAGPGPKQDLLELWSASGEYLRTIVLSDVVPQYPGFEMDIAYTMTADGDLVLFADTESPVTGLQQDFMVRTDSTGHLRWVRFLDELGFPNQIFSIFDLKETSNGDLIMAGLQMTGLSGSNIVPHLILWKTDSAGVYRSNSIGGLLAHDTDVNCLVDPAEPRLPNRVLRVEAPSQQTYYTQTGADGRYSTPVETGTYTITPLTPNYLWEPCDTQQVLVFPADTTNYAAVADFPYQALADCPLMTVSLGAPYLHYCDTTTYFVQYNNLGTATGTDAAVAIELAADVTFAGSAQPHTQTGQTVRFELGDVPSGTYGNFQFQVIPGCDSTAIEQTLCLTAHIFPDVICSTPAILWSGGGIDVSGICDGDSVRFLVKNIGFAPTSELDFIIADDHVIMYNGVIPPLDPNAVRTYSAPATGDTWRFVAEQEPNFPGASSPSVAVEACAPGGTFSTGYVNQFPNSTGNPFEAVSCRRFYLFPDSTVLSAVPTGAGSQHLISAAAPIEYLVYYVNTGSDAATPVTIVDTLPAALDPATVDPGAASAPYTWSVSGANVLTIQQTAPLGPGKGGFVQFQAAQKPGNAPGTLIENRATVQLGQQAAQTTNTVRHTVAPQGLFAVSTEETRIAVPDLQVFPNPAERVVFVQTNSTVPTVLCLRDLTGRLLFEKTASGPVVSLSRNGLPTGIYILEARVEGRLTGIGKLLWR